MFACCSPAHFPIWGLRTTLQNFAQNGWFLFETSNLEPREESRLRTGALDHLTWRLEPSKMWPIHRCPSQMFWRSLSFGTQSTRCFDVFWRTLMLRWNVFSGDIQPHREDRARSLLSNCWLVPKAKCSGLSFYCADLFLIFFLSPAMPVFISCQTSSVGRWITWSLGRWILSSVDRSPRRHLLRTPSILCGWLQEFWGAGAVRHWWLVGFTTDGYDHPYSEAWLRLTSLASHTGWFFPSLVWVQNWAPYYPVFPPPATPSAPWKLQELEPQRADGTIHYGTGQVWSDAQNVADQRNDGLGRKTTQPGSLKSDFEWGFCIFAEPDFIRLEIILRIKLN